MKYPNEPERNECYTAAGLDEESSIAFKTYMSLFMSLSHIKDNY
jgi:hypothetical protein